MKVDEDALVVARTFGEKCRSVLGENLVSIVLYGSTVRGNRVRGRSDVNVLIVLDKSTPEAHRVIAEQLRHTPQISPFVLSRWELPRSCRVFAIKFRSIARDYKVLFGDDPLADFAPSQQLLLFLCEQALRNMRLRLKHDYICNVDKPSRYGQVLARNTTSLFVTLSEVLRCAGITVPEDFKSRPELIGVTMKVDASVLHDLLELHSKSVQKLSAEQAFDLHARLFRLLSASLDKVREQWPQAIEIQ